MIPSIGRIVHLRLSEGCAASINKARAESGGALKGNTAKEGDVYPLLITRVWGDEPTETTPVNGQVHLDGNDCLWVTSVVQGDGPGQWFAPPRA
jgi:hypothetical protein